MSHRVSLAMFLLAIAALSRASTFTEDFTTTTYWDAAETTANWNTGAGELGLHPFEPSIVSGVATGHVRNVAVSGNLVFVANGSQGFLVIDITDPASPVTIGSLLDAWTKYDLAVAGDHVFAVGTSGIQGLDVSDPTTPVLVGSAAIPGTCLGVALAGDHAFVANGSDGLRVIDISDPTSPAIVGLVDTPGSAYDVTLAGDLAYVADLNFGLQVIDISDPTTPGIMSNVDTPGSAASVAVSGDIVHLTDQADGLHMIDVSDPTSPTIVGSIDPGLAAGIAVSGDVAILADFTAGLLLIDITDPTMPTILSSAPVPAGGTAVTVAGNLAFVADGNLDLQVFEIATPASPLNVGSVDTPDETYSVAIAGDVAYVADLGSGVQVVDISDPATPAIIGSVNTPGDARDIVATGDVVYLADDASGLQVIDVSDPTAPAIIGSMVTPGRALGLAVEGDLAIVGDFTSGQVLTVDISSPAAPSIVGSVLTPERPFSVAVAGDVAYVTDYNVGLRAIDISDPAIPVEIGSVATPGPPRTVTLSGDVAFVSAREAGVVAIDVSDPTTPTIVGSVDTPGFATGVTGIAVAGDVAFVADYDFGVQVIDISDPTTLAIIGGLDTPGLCRSVVLAGEHAFVSDGEVGLQMMRVFQHTFDESRNVGQSLPLPTGTDIVMKTRLSSVQTDHVSWELSANGESDFTSVVPGADWMTINPGQNLVWRSTHALSASLANPAAQEVTIEWLTKWAPIISITDVPDDEGRAVSLTLTRSAHEFDDETTFPVVGYAIYRRVDQASLVRDVMEVGTMPDAVSLDGTPLASYGPDRVRLIGDREFVLGDALAAGDGFPPGVWEGVGWVLPERSDTYTTTVATAADSSGFGIPWSVYLTATHTTTPAAYFLSEPDSAYSVDNRAPAAPTGLALVGNDLSWDTAPESDFAYHSVYGSSSSEFDPGATFIDYTIDATYDVTGHVHAYFHVTTTDFADNEGDAASIESDLLSAPEMTVPSAYALAPPGPNPVRSGTTLTFTLPEREEVVLVIYDTGGRAVRTLARGAHRAAVHRVSWEGRDDDGRPIAPGVYFARLRAGAFHAERRLTVVR